MTNKINPETIAQLQELAKLARCVDDADWGSDRQVDAENAFYQEARRHMTQVQIEKLDSYTLKSTTEEGIGYALSLLLIAFDPDEPPLANQSFCVD